MQDNGCSITFTQIHLYRFVSDEYVMTYSLRGRMFSHMISMIEIVSDRQTEFIPKNPDLQISNKSTISRFLHRFRQTAFITTHIYKTKVANLRTNWKPNLHLLQSPKNHRYKTCIAKGYVSLLRTYQEQGVHKYSHPPAKNTHTKWPTWMPIYNSSQKRTNIAQYINEQAYREKEFSACTEKYGGHFQHYNIL
jgi:hypothetical protein